MDEKSSSSSEEKNKEKKVLEIKSELQCPVTLQLFNQPVCLSSGQTVEKDVADNALNADKLCPISRKSIDGYSDNILIKKILNKYLTKYPEARKKQYVLGSYGKKSSEASSGYTGPVKPVEQNPAPSAPPLPNEEKKNDAVAPKTEPQAENPAVVQVVVQHLPPQEQKQNVNSLAGPWYRALAEQGNADAQFELGRSYCSGNCDVGEQRKCKESLRWLEAAAEQGHARAQEIVANAYDRGFYDRLWLEHNYEKATRFYRAIEKEEVYARLNLRSLYQRRLVPFVPQDRAIYQTDVKSGISEARAYLARIQELDTLEAELFSLIAGNLGEFKSTLLKIRETLNGYIRVSPENQTVYLQALITRISKQEGVEKILDYLSEIARDWELGLRDEFKSQHLRLVSDLVLQCALGSLDKFKAALSQLKAMFNRYETSSENQTIFLQTLIMRISELNLSDDIRSYVISWGKINKLNIDALQEGYTEVQQNRFEQLSNQLAAVSTVNELVNTIDALCHYVGKNTKVVYDKIVQAGQKYLSLLNETAANPQSEQKMINVLNFIPYTETECYKTAEAILVEIFRKKVEQILPGKGLLQNGMTVKEVIESIHQCVAELKQKQSKFKSIFSQDPVIQKLSELQHQMTGLNRRVLSEAVDVNNDNNAVIPQPVPSAPPKSAEREVELKLPSVSTHPVVWEDEAEAEVLPAKVEQRVGVTG